MLPGCLEAWIIASEHGEPGLQTQERELVDATLNKRVVCEVLEARDERTQRIGRMVEDPLDDEVGVEGRVHRRRELVGLEDANELARRQYGPSRERSDAAGYPARVRHFFVERLESDRRPVEEAPLHRAASLG